MVLAPPLRRGQAVSLDRARRALRAGLPARWFRRLTVVAVASLAVIIVSGAAVRLTGSGLGCPDWPTCASGHVVAPWRFHAWIEFGNRLITGVLSVAVFATLAGALLRDRRRRDLTLLSLGLVAGVAAEIVLGGLTVEHGLAPGFVMAHFLLAVVFLADAVVLHHRAGLPEEPVPGRRRRAVPAGPAVALVGPELRILARILLPSIAVVVALGAVVTSTGPHGGAPSAPRFALSLHDVAQLHGASVEVTIGITAALLLLLARSGAPRPVLRHGEALLGILIVQGAIGYTQYFLGVPALLVGVHVAGAVAVVIAVLRFNLVLTARPSTPVPPAPAARLVPELVAPGVGG